MSGELSPLCHACGVLDVPVGVVELSRDASEMVWYYVVRNRQARLAGRRAAQYFLEESFETGIEWTMLMLGLKRDCPGVRGEVLSSSRTPEWLVKWMVDEGFLTEEERRRIAAGTWSVPLQRYLVVSGGPSIGRGSGQEGEARTQTLGDVAQWNTQLRRVRR